MESETLAWVQLEEGQNRKAPEMSPPEKYICRVKSQSHPVPRSVATVHTVCTMTDICTLTTTTGSVSFRCCCDFKRRRRATTITITPVTINKTPARTISAICHHVREEDDPSTGHNQRRRQCEQIEGGKREEYEAET